MAIEKVFKISDEQIKEMYLNGSSLNDIAKIAQNTKGLMALRNRLHKLGVSTTKNMKRYSLKISKNCKNYTLNEHIFDIIDTQEKAYWLGFLMADGYNHESHCCVALRLQEEDREILEKFKTFLNSNNPIYTFTRKTPVGKIDRNYCELNICSPYFCRSLAKLGCIQAKTLTLKLPKLKDTLMQHFIRGYFDGDGCFSVIKRNDRKNLESKAYQFNIVGMLNPIQEIQDIICKNANVTKTPIRYRDSKAVTISWEGKNVCSKILNYLYKDATIYLKRKHDKYIKYCISAE